MCKYHNITTIAFDADDTLWENENHYRNTETAFCDLLKNYANAEKISQELLKTEISNIELYGYGAKSFTLSMIETAISISDSNCPNAIISSIIELSKTLIAMPVKVLPNVNEVLEKLSGSYKLVLATKGDLLDQERKLKKSGLAKYFIHIEIMSNKNKEDYIALMKKTNCKSQEFLMIGNTIKSDILPVLDAGAKAIHIPYHITWDHEKSEHNKCFDILTDIKDIPNLLNH